MKMRALVVLFCVIMGWSFAKKSTSRLQLINKALESTFLAFEGSSEVVSHQPVSSEYSSILDVCHNLDRSQDKNRIACCTPNDVKHIYNVLIEDRKLVLFVPSKKEANAKSKALQQLPPVQSVRSREKVNNMLSIEYREGPFDPSKHCTRYLNGTLHFPGRSTVHNVYHALGDNVLPLMGQMLLDYYLAGDLLYQPRMILTNFQNNDGRDPLRQVSGKRTVQNTVNINYRGGMDESSVAPHLRLMEDVMSEGALPLSQASGMCFRRVVWGHGPHMFYTAMLQRLRRLVGYFAREFATELVKDHFLKHSLWHRWNEEGNPNFKQQLMKTMDTNATLASNYLLNNKGQPMKVLLYTRGNSGKGRTIQNEHLIVEALQAHGAEVFICCNFANTSLEQQLYYAINADMIIGMHGAALTHGIFMAPGTITLELKTLYAYESILFPLISDAHLGIHAQVNIKKYFVPGGQKPIDAPLITRIMRVLQQARGMQRKLHLSNAPDIVQSQLNKLIPAAVNHTASYSIVHEGIEAMTILETGVHSNNNNSNDNDNKKWVIPSSTTNIVNSNINSPDVTNAVDASILNKIKSVFGNEVKVSIQTSQTSPLNNKALVKANRGRHSSLSSQPQVSHSLRKVHPAQRHTNGNKLHSNNNVQNKNIMNSDNKQNHRLLSSQKNANRQSTNKLSNSDKSNNNSVNSQDISSSRVPYVTQLEQSQVCKFEDLVDFVGGVTINLSAKDVQSYDPVVVGKTGAAVRGDLVFGTACSDILPESANNNKNHQKRMTEITNRDGLRHVLGPFQETHSSLCQASIYQYWRLALENKEEGIHCRMCDPYVL